MTSQFATLCMKNIDLKGVDMMDKKLIHICEVCGKTEIMTPEAAFNDGWDYPPRMGSLGLQYI